MRETGVPKNESGLKILFSLHGEKIYLVHKRTESGTETVFCYLCKF